MFLIRKKIANLGDEELIKAYQSKQDTKYIGMLFSRYAHLAFGLCLKYLKDEEEAQDSVMEIFEQLMDKLKSTHPTNFSSWLYVVSKNHCLMKLRKRKKEDKHTTSYIYTEGADEEELELQEKLIHEERLESLETAIATLKDEQQVCVRLFFIESKSYKEVAEMTGFDLNQVKSYIQNGKRMIKQQMEKS
jgi:RNA polymerase sigma factor (sigma-70 family)